jgi:two-component system, LuxR family, response regulator FixJ
MLISWPEPTPAGLMAAKLIFIVDDDEAVRESLSALLEAKGFAVEAFPTAEAFLAAPKREHGLCALIDLRMPGMDGLTLLERLGTGGSRLPMIMVTGHGDVPLAVKAMKAGAFDFVEKPYTNEILLGAINRAADVAERSGFDDVDPAQTTARIEALTPRERDVLDQLVVGHANKIIAHELSISPRTVEIHRANLMKKMQADSLSHLVRMALAAGLGGKRR